MSDSILVYAADSAGAALKAQAFELGALGAFDIEIEVEFCGVCHSDLSMLNNEWGNTRFPFVGGHEVVGRVVARGSAVRGHALGSRVGVGWTSASCGECRACVSGDAIFCAQRQATIVGRFGGFANRLRCQALWAVPVPDALSAQDVGPLFCGGITVFNPLLEFGVRPTHRVAVVGIGGLGHLAVQFCRAWGCEVTAITSQTSKRDDLHRLGAHAVMGFNDTAAYEQKRGAFDFILQTTHVPQDWSGLMRMLAPRGQLVLLGVTTDAIPVQAMQLISGNKAIVGNATGSPGGMLQMLEFAARHKIAAQTELFAMRDINAAMQHLASGKARYRVVLANTR